MPARSKIDQLPPEIRDKFQKELLAKNFCGYEEIADWLNAQLADEGLEIRISRSGVHRFGQEFQAKCEDVKTSTEMARAFVGASGDDEGNLNEATIRLIQTMVFDLLLKAKKDEDGKYDVADILPKIGVMVAKLSKASVDVKKYATEIKKKTEQAVVNIESKAKKRMDPELFKIVKEEIYGIA